MIWSVVEGVSRRAYQVWLRLSPLIIRAESLDDDSSLGQVDMVIPVHSKDVSKVKSILKYYSENDCVWLGNIYIVGTEEESPFGDACCKYVWQDDFFRCLGLDVSGVSGWYLQQIVKLYALEYFGLDRVLICDGDTLLLRKPLEVVRGKRVFLYSYEYNTKYSFFLDELSLSMPFRSHITHHMYYYADEMLGIKQLIQARFNKSVFEYVKHCSDREVLFSEYELIAQVGKSHSYEEVYFRNKNVLDESGFVFDSRFYSVSLQEWRRGFNSLGTLAVKYLNV